MKILLNLFLFLSAYLYVFSQTGNNADSLINLISRSKPDTSKVNLLIKAGKSVSQNNPAKSIDFAIEALALSKKLGFKKGSVLAENLLGVGYSNTGKYDSSLSHYQSSIQLANQINDKESVSIAYTNIGIIYYYKSDFPKALENYKKALKISEEIKDTEGEAYSYNSIALVYNYQGKYFDALNVYNKALGIFHEHGNKAAEAAIYNNIGIIQTNLGNFKDAIDSYFKALKANEDLKNFHSMAVNYSGIGMLHTANSNYDEALQYNFKALDLFKRTGDKRNEGVTLNNISSLYLDKNELERALHFDSLALKISDSIGNKANVAQCYLNIGAVNFKKNDYPKSIENYRISLTLFQEVGDTSNLSLLSNNLAKVFLAKEEYANAKIYALQALNYALKIKETQRIRDAHQTLSIIGEKEGNLKDALLHYKAFVTAKDSLFNEANTKKIVQTQMEYDFDKRQLISESEHKRQLALEQQKRKSAFLIGITVVVAVLIIGGLIFYFYRKFQKNKLRFQVAEVSQEALRAQLDSHFVTGTLTSINEFIMQNDTDSASEYLLSFTAFIRDILESSFQKTVTIQEEIEFIKTYLEFFLLRYPKEHITYSISIGERVDGDSTLIPPMVLQVLVDNAVRHGFDNKHGGFVGIEIQRTNNGIFCRVRDNGKGRSAAQLQSFTDRKSYGGLLAEKLLEIWKTTFGKTSYKITDLMTPEGLPLGTLVEFTFPMIEK